MGVLNNTPINEKDASQSELSSDLPQNKSKLLLRHANKTLVIVLITIFILFVAGILLGKTFLQKSQKENKENKANTNISDVKEEKYERSESSMDNISITQVPKYGPIPKYGTIT